MSQGESATPLGKVRGLGSAREGGHHWLEERFTSIALLLLSFWLLFSLFLLPDLSLVIIKEWLGSAWGAIPMALLVITVMLPFASHAQEKVEMADVMRSNGKIYVIVGIILIVLIGLFVYLFSVDRKVARLEKKLENPGKPR